MNFGFSYIGLTFLLMLMIPNIIWSKNMYSSLFGIPVAGATLPVLAFLY